MRAGLPPGDARLHATLPCMLLLCGHKRSFSTRVATGTGHQPACLIKAGDGEEDRVFQENKKDTHTPHTEADFSDGSVVETQHAQCREHGFDSLSGN